MFLQRTCSCETPLKYQYLACSLWLWHFPLELLSSGKHTHTESPFFLTSPDQQRMQMVFSSSMRGDRPASPQLKWLKAGTSDSCYLIFIIQGMSRNSVSSWNALYFPKTQNFTRVNGNLSPSPLGELILAEILIKLPLQYPELCKHNLPKPFHSEQLPNVPVGVNIGTSGPIA